jgi:hypothetical protein
VKSRQWGKYNYSVFALLDIYGYNDHMSARSLADSHLRLAGWFSFLSAIITLPLFVFAIIAATESTRTSGIALISTLAFIFHTGIYCYVYLTLRDYLHTHFSFTKIDRQINSIVGISIAAAVLDVVAFIFADMKDVISLITFVLIIPLGIVSIQMGLRLLQLKDTLFGLRNPLSYLFIFVGIFLTSIILLLPGLLLGLAVDVLLGIILLRAAQNADAK